MSVTFAPLYPTVLDGEETLYIDGNHPLAVNVTNTNAAHLLTVLGLDPFEPDGETTGEDLLGRVLTAQATEGPDTGVAPEGERIIDCGRRPGYTGDKLISLRELAQAAYEADLCVAWC